MLRKWDRLPANMRTDAVRPYYEALKRKQGSLALKRAFDIAASALMLIVASPLMLAVAALIAADSRGGVFYRQERVTQYGKVFRIYKFRTMVKNADRIGAQVTVSNDSRVTKVGAKLRKYRLDEVPQLFNVLKGEMSLVGTRPESVHYVQRYTPEMMATLLLPAGVTSETSIRYKDEAELLDRADDVDRVYVEQILPEKMKYNLESLRQFSLGRDLKTLFRTVAAVVQ